MISRHGRPNLNTSLDSDDRAVFDIWARRVTAFYTLLTISLVAVMLLGAHPSAEKKLVAATSGMEKAVPAPITGSIGK